MPPTRTSSAPGQLRQGWRRLRRNRSGMVGLVLITVVVLVAAIGPWLAPYAPDDQSAMLGFAARGAPSWAHPFGTDRNGYDVLTRVIYGAPTALAVGLGAMVVAALIGILIGGIAGYLAVVRLFGIVVVGTWLERVPYLNLTTIVVLLGLFGWPPIARLARAEFLRLKGMDFVEAARCIGAQPFDILFRHILPNALPSLAVVIALGIGGAILAESMVSFLGFGDPKAVSWGQLLYFNYQVLKVSPWAVLAPGTAIFITVLGFNLLADGLSDAFNPRLKQ
jgi:ABC-type dipeptide/oligopeptide/nickel transport system permease subunit